MWGSIIGGGLSLAGSVLGGLGGGKQKKSYLQKRQEQLAIEDMNRKNDFMGKYNDLYNKYYFPMEETAAQDYIADYGKYRPYQQNMMNYQLGRGDELIDMAKETNPMLDANRKDIIRRLTEGEDVLRDRMQTEASTDMQSAMDAQKEQGLRSMNMYGVNPNSGAFGSFMSNMTTTSALGQAGARTQASRQAEDLSLERGMQAQNMYTNPNMLFTPNRPQPGMSAGQFMGSSALGGGGGMSSGGSSGGGGGGGDFWGGIGSGVGGLMNGLGGLFGSGGGSGGGSSNTGIGSSGWTGGLGGGSDLLSGFSW